jgi:hypothetical protein
VRAAGLKHMIVVIREAQITALPTKNEPAMAGSLELTCAY